VPVPCVTLRELGVAEIVKSGPAAAVTPRVTVADRLSTPLVPVIVSVELLAGVLPVVVTVSVELPDPVTDVGEKLGDAPAGSPDALRLTAPEKPLSALTVTV
jgi:hypothetical protein